MVIDLKKLLEWLEFEDHRIEKLKKSIIASWDTPKKLRTIIDRQCEYREQTHCYSCDNESGCLALNGIGYLRLGEIETAIKELETANLHFRNQGETWNHIISLMLIGEAYARDKKSHRALREFEKAYEAIKLFAQMHSTEYIERVIFLEKMLGNLVDREPVQQEKMEAQIVLPWMPTYTKLQASPSGPTWIENRPQGKSAIIAKIILDKNPHDVYSLKQGDNLITLTENKKYGWAKVSGNSMNGTRPMPILENDFVLFYESCTADNNAIVIAAYSDNTGAGYQYVVRRYSQNIWSLVSETEPPDTYDPMPVMDNVKIIGVVIAVAKASI